MGEQTIQQGFDSAELREFTRKLLADLHALEKMLADGCIESGVTRVGAEQELVLVDRDWRPAMWICSGPRSAYCRSPCRSPAW